MNPTPHTPHKTPVYYQIRIALFTIFSILSFQVLSQSCLDPIDSLHYENILSKAHLSLDYRANNPNRESVDIPVVFVYARNADGELGESSIGDENTLETWINSAIEVANNLYGDEFNLVQFGDIIYIDHDEIHTILTSLVGFFYLTNAIVVNIMPGKGVKVSSASLPLHDMPPPPGMENDPDNLVLMGPKYLNPNTIPDDFAHEIGHVFDLLHTFQWYGSSSMGQQTYITERVTRVNDPNKTYGYNCDVAGDLVCDTDADCLRNFAACFPNCMWSTDYCTISELNNRWSYTGTYTDLNDDYLINNDLTERNIMSYYLCRDLVTNGQFDRVAKILDSYRTEQFNANNYDLSDYIEFEGTTKKMKNILTIFNFPSIGNYTDMRIATHRYTTNSSGKIETILLDEVIKAQVIFGGEKVTKGSLMLFENTFLPVENSVWTDSLDILDIIAIQKYIGYPNSQFGQNTLPGGYKKIAADVNDDGMITEADFKLIQELILGKVTTFSAFPQPWRFVPEFISQGSFGFHNNPFDRTINSNFVPKADYTKPDFSFDIVDGFDSKAGFDGVKIGNTAYKPDYLEHPGMLVTNFTSSTTLFADTSYNVTLSIKSNSYNATQLKLIHQNGFIDEESLSCNVAIDSFSMNNINFSSDDSIISILWSLPGITLDSIYFITFEFVPSISSSDMSDYFYFDNELFENFIIDTSGITASGTVHLIINNSEEGAFRSSDAKRVDEQLSFVTLSPNPTNDQLLVQVGFSGELFLTKPYTIDVMDANGTNYYQAKGFFEKQNSELILPVQNLVSGFYYLRLSLDGQYKILSFTKQ